MTGAVPRQGGRILIVSPHSPSPTDSGGRIRLASLIRGLAPEYRVSLLLLGEGRSDLGEAHAGLDLVKMPFPPWDALRPQERARHNLAALFRATLPGYERVNRASVHAALKLRASVADLVLLDTTSFAPFAPTLKRSFPSLPVIVNTHDVDSQLYTRLASTGNLVARLHKFTLSKLALHLEQDFYRCCDAAFAVSEVDRALIARLNRHRLRTYVVPNAVDTSALQRLPLPTEPTLIFCGVLNYRPNVEGVQWLIRSVLPLVRAAVPGVRLLLVGRRPSPEVARLRSDAVEVHADVADVRPFYARSAVAVVPLRRGGGTRLKILEAMALGRPVVATTAGADGMPRVPGVAIADDPADFAAQIAALLSNPPPRDLAETSVAFVEANYSWSSVAQLLQRIVARELALARERRGVGSLYPKSSSY